MLNFDLCSKQQMLRTDDNYFDGHQGNQDYQGIFETSTTYYGMVGQDVGLPWSSSGKSFVI